MMRRPVQLTALDLAHRFAGLTEVAGPVHNPQVLAMLRLDAGWVADDETPWCSAFVNYICWLLRLERSKSLSARSWLDVGQPVKVEEAMPGFCVVVLKRGPGRQPGPDVRSAPGHVGFLESVTTDYVAVLGGNQSNAVNVKQYPRDMILGIREV